MVLYQRKPVQYDLLTFNADLLGNPDCQVWQIPETKEVYLNYEDYLQRSAFYETRAFACEISGKTALTHRDAMQSELAEAKEIDANFSEALKEPVLRKAHGSALPRLDALVDMIFDAFKAEYFPGEKVATLVGNYKETALVREKTKVAEMIFPDGFHRPASARYVVEILDPPEDGNMEPLVTVDESALFRERGVFTKVILRVFLKNTLRRDARIGAPWKVKSIYAERYRIAPIEDSISMPQSSKNKKKDTSQDVEANDSLSRVIDGPTTKTTVEDMNLPTKPHERPRLARAFPVRTELVSHFLEIWSFFNVFLEVLILDSFTLDDFGDALLAHEKSELLDELFCCLLKTISEDKTQALPTKADVEGENGSISLPALEMQTLQNDPLVRSVLRNIPNWKHDLVKQEFRNDHYIMVLIGLISARSLSPEKPHLHQIIQCLQMENCLHDSRPLATSFRELSPDAKVQLLVALIDLTWQTRLVRQYIDECMDHLTSLRKERADATRDRKSKTDAIYQLRLKMRAQFPRLLVATTGVSKDAQARRSANDDSHSARLDSSDVEIDPENNWTDDLNPRKRRRVSSRLNQQNEPEPDTESQDGSVPDDSNVVYKNRGDYERVISKIQKSVYKADIRIQKIDEEFRESDAQRLRNLGQDRFYNTYWWLESCGMPVYGMPNCSTSYAEFATGRVFVQGPTQSAMTEIKQRSALHEYDYAKRRQTEEGKDSLEPDTWGYYEDETQITTLLDWLDPRGQREAKLKTAIESRHKVIFDTMQHRVRYLSDETLLERRTTRNTDVVEQLARFQRWKNTMARNTLGEPHSGDVNVKGVASSKRRKR